MEGAMRKRPEMDETFYFVVLIVLVLVALTFGAPSCSHAMEMEVCNNTEDLWVFSIYEVDIDTYETTLLRTTGMVGGGRWLSPSKDLPPGLYILAAESLLCVREHYIQIKRCSTDRISIDIDTGEIHYGLNI